MKVIAGTARGRNIQAPKSGRLRITSDRVKEALFNILGSVEDMRVLDIFAGSGNMGIEALSRGASKVVFIENDRAHLATITQNLERCRFTTGHEIMAVSFDRAIPRLRESQEIFDVIFADPPYDRELAGQTLAVLAANPILDPEGIVVVEHSSRESWTGNDRFAIADRRVYGDTVLSFLKPL